MFQIPRFLTVQAWLFAMIMLPLVSAAQVTASFSVNASSGCKPMTVQFTNTSVNATAYSWNFGNGNNSTQQSPANIYTSAGNYTVTLTATGPSGSSTTTTIISVAAAPVAAFTSNTTTVCEDGNAVQFMNQSAGFDSCIWDFGDGVTSNANDPSHIFTLPGTFTVTLIVYDRSTGCSSSISKTHYINVIAAPVIAFTASDSSSCNSNHNFILNATGSNIAAWQWLFGDGMQSFQQNTSHVYGDTGQFDVSLIATSHNGCTDTLVKDDFIHVKYNPVPVITPSDSQGCVPMNVSFQTSKTNVASYWWDLGDGSTDSIYIAYHVYTIPGNYVVGLTVEYNNGCMNSNTFNTVSVDSIPSFTYSIANNTGCAPLNVQFNNNNAGAGYSWLWNFGDGNTSSDPVPAHIYTSDGTFTVSLYATSPNGCTWGYPLSAKVKVVSPQALFTPDKISGCMPLTVNFNNHSLNAGSYSWDFGDGVTSVLSNPSHIYNNAGNYTVKLIAYNTNGCSDTFIYSSPVSVSMGGNSFNPLPPVTACAPFTMHFEDNSPSTAWLWDFGDGTTSVLQNPDHTYELPGTYIVSLSTQGGSGGCSQHVPNLRTIIINSGVADFTHVEELCPPYKAYFTDSSTNAVAWFWSFGDGATSTLQNPVHIFNSPGYHNIALTITTPEGCEATTVKNFEVYFEPLTATATTYVADTLLPMTVQFYSNTVGATWWNWTFGDGDSSSLEDPSHIYNTAGPHTVTLTIGNDSCSRTYSYQPQSFGMGAGVPVDPAIGVPVPPPVLYNCAPFTVSYQNPFAGAVSWQWDFGDGNTSALENPEHTYTTSGTFHTRLIVQYAWGGMDSVLLPEPVNVKAFDANFTISSTSSCSGIQVTLYPSDTIASFSWEFGDGSASMDPVPSHTYSSSAFNYLITVVVTDTNGCISSATQTFYASESNPLSVSTTRACAGDSVQFSCGNINYNSYLWNFGDGTTSFLPNPTHVYSDSGTFAVTLSAFDSTGCMKTFNLQNQIQIFNPIANFIISDVIPYCNYVAVQLSNLSTGYDQLLWDMGNGQTMTQTPSYVYYYTPGSYTISLTASGNVCSSTFTSPVAVVVPDLKADFSYVQSGNCTPVTLTFTDQSNDAVSWLWDFGDGSTDTVPNPVHVYHSYPANAITLTVKDIYGCVEKKIVSGLHFSDASFNVGSATGCLPLSVSFTDSSVNATSWHWSFGDGDTSTDQHPMHVYTAEGVYDVQLIIGTAAGCSDTITMDDYVQVGSVTASFQADVLSGCAPLLVQFADSSYNASSWLWDFGDGSVSANNNPSHIYTVPGTYDVTLIAFDSLGCSDTIVQPAAIAIYGAVPAFTLPSTEGCQPFEIAPVNLSQGAVLYEWNFGNGATDTSSSPSFTFDSSGIYILSLTVFDTSGCMSTFTSPTPVVVNATPQAGFTLGSLAGCTPFAPAISNTSSGVDSIIWSMGDGTYYHDTLPMHQYENAGSFTIMQTVYSSSGCSDSTLVSGVNVFLTPDAAFAASDTVGCAPVSIDFYNLSSDLDSALFLWNFGNGMHAFASDTSVLYAQPGSYNVSLSVINKGGCTDVYSIQDYITIYDATPPPAARLYSASVTGGSEIEVKWNLVNQNDLDYYVLYRLNDNTMNFDSVGSYINTNSTIVTLPELTDNVITSLNPFTYKVSTVDKCGSSLDLNLLKAHTTVFLSGFNNGSAISLSWTKYDGCPVSGYNIYRRELNSNFVLIGSTDSSTTLYNDLTAFCPVLYEYRVEATGICNEPMATAYSNIAAVDHSTFQWQQDVEMIRATVVNNQFVLVEWRVPAQMPQTITGYEVYRSVDMVNFSFMADVGASQLYYEDYSADINSENYYYKIIPLNSCNIANAMSEESSSILLDGVFQENGKARLRWTHYRKWNTGVDHYVLERQNDDGSWEAVQSVDGTINEAQDQ